MISSFTDPKEQPLHLLSRVGLVDQAYHVIKTAIINHELEPGTTLTTVNVSERLGVSRTPVRQALLLLAQQGLLDTDNRGQFVVHVISPAEAQEIFLVRASLESLASRKIARLKSTGEISVLQEILAKQQIAQREQDTANFLQYDQDFHLSIARFASLPLVMRLLERLRDKVRVIGGQAITRPGRLGSVIVEHQAILNGLIAQDEDGAVRAVVRHLVNTAQSVGISLEDVIDTATGFNEGGSDK